MLDKSGNRLASSNGINYDFTISDSYLTPIAEFYNETLDSSGNGRPLNVRFESPGPIEITMCVNPSNIDAVSESATFNTVVAPEFPAISVVFVAGAAIAAILTRFQRNKQ